jgi:hypothetical protein
MCKTIQLCRHRHNDNDNIGRESQETVLKDGVGLAGDVTWDFAAPEEWWLSANQLSPRQAAPEQRRLATSAHNYLDRLLGNLE